jgi:alkanesulfonate monooxygenase SsuD/methylene tetrahydromethanopterin reductase-like flavin-dependent oxidoreductase (luciferase family)
LCSGERCTFNGRFNTIEDAILLPPPHRPIPLMIGSTGERVLRAALPHAHWWNTWFDWFGNSAEGFAKQNDHISEIAREVGRDPATLKRSACLLVVTDASAGERPTPSTYTAATLSDLRQRVLEMRDAGADEVILVSDPINERSIHTLAETLR